MSKISYLRRPHCLGLWLERGVLNRLRYLRGPGGSYSDAILRWAEEEAA
jgi:Zn-finger nucleic acid-binding protein